MVTYAGVGADLHLPRGSPLTKRLRPLSLRPGGGGWRSLAWTNLAGMSYIVVAVGIRPGHAPQPSRRGPE